MIRPDHRDFRSKISVKRDDSMFSFQVFLSFQCMRADDNAIYHISIQHIQKFFFPVADSYSTWNQSLISQLIQGCLCLSHITWKKRMIYIRYQYSYDSGFITKQISRQFIWCILQFLNCFFNFLFCISWYISISVYNSGNGSHPYACSARYISYTRHTYFSCSVITFHSHIIVTVHTPIMRDVLAYMRQNPIAAGNLE